MNVSSNTVEWRSGCQVTVRFPQAASAIESVPSVPTSFVDHTSASSLYLPGFVPSATVTVCLKLEDPCGTRCSSLASAPVKGSALGPSYPSAPSPTVPVVSTSNSRVISNDPPLGTRRLLGVHATRFMSDFVNIASDGRTLAVGSEGGEGVSGVAVGVDTTVDAVDVLVVDPSGTA